MQLVLNAQNWLVNNWKWLLGVLVAVAVAYMLNHWANRLEGFTGSSDQNTFTMVYVDWCPHCKDAKPHFQSLMDNWNGKQINGKTVVIEMLNGESKNSADQAKVKELKVESYPTLILTKDGKHVAYDGERTEEAMLSWLNKNI